MICDGDRHGQVQSLVRAFSLLEAVAACEQGLTLTEVAHEVKLPRSTAHRLLVTMDALRYVELDQATNRWMIGASAFTLGSSFLGSRDLGRLGRPIMQALMREADQTVNIFIIESDSARCVGQSRPTAAPRALTKPGIRLPMYATASGKAMLANAAMGDVDALLGKAVLSRRTATTIVDRSILVEQFATIRERGYAVDDQENETGIRCVAAPIFEVRRQVRASISITGPVARFPDQRLEILGRSLTRAAAQMSAEFGMLLAA